MFTTIMKTKTVTAALFGLVLTALPTAAFAHHHGFHVDVVVPSVEVAVPAAPCDAPADRVWVEPVYRTVTDRVWIEPVTTTRVQRVEVPAQYGYRDVVVEHYGREHMRREQVEICPAHIEDQAVTVVVVPGHFENQTHQEVVCDGHWESRVVEPARLEIRLPF